jgi:hypothetical protein
VLWLIGSGSLATTQETKSDPGAAYLNPKLPLEQRVHDLISRMTLEEKVQQMMNAAPAIPRLGIPQYDWWNEALHGVAFSGVATVFPQAIGLGATFDPQLVNRVATVILLRTVVPIKIFQMSSVRSEGSWYHSGSIATLLDVSKPLVRSGNDPAERPS